MNTFTDVALVGAGILAGTLGSAGAITSLISYPALLAVGIPALPANVTNAVALVANWPGSAIGSRPELKDQWPRLKRWAPCMIGGGAVGAALLLSTPPGAFVRVVPFLVAIASVSLLAQPRLSMWRSKRVGRHDHLLLPGGLFAVAVYDGYFGAGAGVLTLTVLALTLGEDLPRTNALKNMALGLTDVVAALGFVIFGPVHWAAAACLSLGVFAGSMIGPTLTRRLPSGAVRVAVAFAGFGLAVQLWIHPS